VPLQGAQEMRLVVTDAGDGITCDCANWAEARLVRARNAPPGPPRYALDAAPFARVVASDPTRTDGARSDRIQEYRAEDVYLEWDLAPNAAGEYVLSSSAGGLGSIGLRWIERRSIRALGIELADAAVAPAPENVQVQFWAGESPYQGNWKALRGTPTIEGANWTFQVDVKANPELQRGTWKVRWIIPIGEKPLTVRRLHALTPVTLTETQFRLEFEPPERGRQAKIEVYNGELVGARTDDQTLRVRHCRPRAWLTEQTVLRFQWPDGGCAVAIDDVLANKVVYVPAYGVFVARADANIDLAGYRQQIAGRETLLDQVRRLPDQTFAQAIAHVHHASQDVLPTLLSLACDNSKFIVQRDGTTQFEAPVDEPEATKRDPATCSCQFRPILGSGHVEKLTRRLDGGWLPAPTVTVDEGGVVYRLRSFVAPYGEEYGEEYGEDDLRHTAAPRDNPWLHEKPIYVVAITLENTQAREADASVKLAFLADVSKNLPAEIQVAAARATVQVGKQVLAVVDAKQRGSLTLSASAGTLTLQGALPPRARAACWVYVPAWKLSADEAAHLAGGEKLYQDFAAYWQRVLAPAMQVQTPDELLNNVIRASQVHCLIAARNEVNGRRIAPWIASVSYGPLESESNSIVRALALFGHEEFARRSLDYFIQRYNEAGFLTTGYTLMGTGWHLWSLGEYYALYRNTAWLKSVAPQVDRVATWITQQRAKTRRATSGAAAPVESGLMPPGVMADWNAFAYYFCLNGYYYAGLRSAAEALADIGQGDAPELLRSAADFRRDILRAYGAVQARMPVFPLRNGTWVAGYPSQLLPGPTGRFFPGEDGNRSWCYDVEVGAHQLVPQGVLPADRADVAAMMEHMEDVQFLASGWFDYPAELNAQDPFNLGGFSKVQPYYTRNAEVYALRDDVKPFVRSYFNTIPSLLSLENLSFQEHFNGAGAWNKTHETGYFLQQTRFMLVLERGDELWLAPLITNQWLQPGMAIEVRNAPTRMGPVSFRIVSAADQGFITAHIEPPTRSTPRALVLRLRHPEGKTMRAVTVNGRSHDAFDAKTETIRIAPSREPLDVKVEY